jgi:hypothetical protein
VVECTALEMRHRCKPIGGSNPSLSASHEQCAEIESNQAFLDPPVSARCRRFKLSNGPNSSPSCATLPCRRDGRAGTADMHRPSRSPTVRVGSTPSKSSRKRSGPRRRGEAFPASQACVVKRHSPGKSGNGRHGTAAGWTLMFGSAGNIDCAGPRQAAD